LRLRWSQAVVDPRPIARPPRSAYLGKFPLSLGAGLREEKLIGREQELALLDLVASQYSGPAAAAAKLGKKCCTADHRENS
jgi:hypothetical protein